jgi:hypothetical protein
MIYIYICRTAPLTSRRCILYIYSTNIRTEYFKHAAHSPFFPLQNAVYFIMLPFFGSCVIHILNTGVLKFKRKFRHLKFKEYINDARSHERQIEVLVQIPKTHLFVFKYREPSSVCRDTENCPLFVFKYCELNVFYVAAQKSM